MLILYSLSDLENIMKKSHLFNNKNSLIFGGHEVGIENNVLELRIFITNVLILVPVT